MKRQYLSVVLALWTFSHSSQAVASAERQEDLAILSFDCTEGVQQGRGPSQICEQTLRIEEEIRAWVGEETDFTMITAAVIRAHLEGASALGIECQIGDDACLSNLQELMQSNAMLALQLKEHDSQYLRLFLKVFHNAKENKSSRVELELKHETLEDDLSLKNRLEHALQELLGVKDPHQLAGANPSGGPGHSQVSTKTARAKRRSRHQIAGLSLLGTGIALGIATGVLAFVFQEDLRTGLNTQENLAERIGRDRFERDVIYGLGGSAILLTSVGVLTFATAPSIDLE